MYEDNIFGYNGIKTTNLIINTHYLIVCKA